MQKDLAKTLREKMTKRLTYRFSRDRRPLQVMEGAACRAGKAVLIASLYELSGQVDLSAKELRETMTEFSTNLQLTGVWPVLRPLNPFATQVKGHKWKKTCVRAGMCRRCCPFHGGVST